MWPLAIGVLSVLLPWITDDSTRSDLGVSQPDGLVALLLGTVAMALAWRRIPSGWIIAGFLTVLLGRDIYRLVQAPSVRPGIGLWIATAAFALAGGLQLVALIRSRLGGAEPT